MNNFGEWLKQEIDKRHISQKELAEISGVTPAQISRIIGGTRGIGPDAIVGIARALKLPPELVFKKAGILPANAEDPWVATMQHKISLLTGPRREMAERLLDTMLNEQDRETRETKPARI